MSSLFVTNNLWPKVNMSTSTLTLGLGHVHTTIEGTFGGGNMTVTIPADSGIPFTLGGQVKFLNSTSNNIIFSVAGGVTVNPFTLPALGPGGICVLEKTAANTYLIVIYETTGTFATNWQGIWASQQTTGFTYSRGFNRVNINFLTTTATSNAVNVITNVTTIPSFLIPTANQVGLMTVVNNSANAVGAFTVNTSGTITIWGTSDFNNFHGSGTEGFNPGTITYKI